MEKNQLSADFDKLSARDVIALRRALGKTLDKADPQTQLAFYKLNLPQFVETAGFIAFTARCFYGTSSEDAGNFGESLKRLKNELKDDSDTLDKRLQELTASNLEDSDFSRKLAALIKRMKKEEIAINFDKLYQDLRYWDSDKQSSKQNWIKSFVQNKGEENVN